MRDGLVWSVCFFFFFLLCLLSDKDTEATFFFFFLSVCRKEKGAAAGSFPDSGCLNPATGPALPAAHRPREAAAPQARKSKALREGRGGHPLGRPAPAPYGVRSVTRGRGGGEGTRAGPRTPGGRTGLPVISEGVDDPPEMLPLQPFLLLRRRPGCRGRRRQRPGLLRLPLPPPPLIAQRGRLLRLGLAAPTLSRPRQLLPLLLVAPPLPPAHRLGRRIPLAWRTRRQRLRFTGHGARGRHPRNGRRQRPRTLPRSLPVPGERRASRDEGRRQARARRRWAGPGR